MAGPDDWLPLSGIQHFCFCRYPGASPALMGKCARLGVDLSFFSPQGRFLARAVGEERGNVLLRQTQYRIADSEAESCLYARNFILGKVYNARWVLERATRDHPQRVPVEQLKRTSAQLAAALPLIEQCDDLDQLRGLEGEAAQRYFDCFDSLILQQHDDFSFAGRSRRWTIPMPCSLSLIRFWPPTARRLFRVWASPPTSAFSTAPGPGAGASPSTSWKNCALFAPTVLCSPASTRKF